MIIINMHHPHIGASLPISGLILGIGDASAHAEANFLALFIWRLYFGPGIWNIEHIPRKFKGGICCGGHLSVTYGGELLYLWIFSQLSPSNNFVKRELPFPREIKLRGESRNNDNVRRSRQMIAPNPKVQELTSICNKQYSRRPIALTQGSKKRPDSTF